MDKTWFFGALLLFVGLMILLDAAGVVFATPVRIAVSFAGVAVAVFAGKVKAARHQP